MISLNDKYFGLTLFTWLMILVLIGLFYFSMTTTSTTEDFEDYESVETSNDKDDDNNKDDDSDSDNNNNKIKLLNFNTSWCGYSVRFQPEWTKFENKMKGDRKYKLVEALDIKCDKPENEKMCKEYDIPGFPAVIIEKDKNRGLYKGPRTYEDLVKTVDGLI